MWREKLFKHYGAQQQLLQNKNQSIIRKSEMAHAFTTSEKKDDDDFNGRYFVGWFFCRKNKPKRSRVTCIKVNKISPPDFILIYKETSLLYAKYFDYLDAM